MNYCTNRYKVYWFTLVVFLGVPLGVSASQYGNGPKGTDTTSVAVVYFNRIERLKLPVPGTVGKRLMNSFDRELNRLQAQIAMLEMGNKRVESFDGFRIEPLGPGEARAIKNTLADELKQWSQLARRYLDAQSKSNVETRLAELEKQLSSLVVEKDAV